VKKLVSVIVPNHGKDLTLLKHSLVGSTYKNYELIVVDEGKERAAQRNTGAKKATGDFFLFLDSDHTISSGLLEEGVALLTNAYDGLFIPEIIVGHPIKTWLRSFYNETRVDAIRFIDKKYWVPFDEDITGFEDWDWDRRFRGIKGTTINPLYHHTKGSVKKKLHYAKWMNKYKEKYPNCPELSLKYRLWTVWWEGARRKRG
jgi:glycosyltransferase involved in cell wall biosynthesis